MPKTTTSTEDTHSSPSRLFDLSSSSLRTSSSDSHAFVLARVVVSGCFLAAGVAKLVGVPKMVATFQEISVGQWFRYVTAAVEIVCALGLLTPAAAPFAAVVLALTMSGALAAHVVVLDGSPAPAVLLLVASSGIAWARRGLLAAAWPLSRDAGVS